MVCGSSVKAHQPRLCRPEAARLIEGLEVVFEVYVKPLDATFARFFRCKANQLFANALAAVPCSNDGIEDEGVGVAVAVADKVDEADECIAIVSDYPTQAVL